jgi:hypothetical protein
VLYLFLGFALLLLASSKLFGLLTVGEEGKVIKDFGLAGIQFFTMLIAVMMSVLLISRRGRQPRRSTTSSPSPCGGGNPDRQVPRTAGHGGVEPGADDGGAARGDGGTRASSAGLLFAAAMTLLEMALLTAFATLFAVLTRPMLGTVFTLAGFVIGHVVEDIWLLTQHVDSGLVRPLVAALYAVLPNLERFNFKTEVVHDLGISSGEVVLTVIYGLAYTAMVLVLACARFRTKDLV